MQNLSRNKKFSILHSIFFLFFISATFTEAKTENDNAGPQSCGEFVSEIMGPGYVGDKSEPTGNGGVAITNLLAIKILLSAME